MPRNGTVVIAGKEYKYVSKMVDTDYGPENEVTFSDETGVLYVYSECMGTAGIIGMLRHYLEVNQTA